MLLVEEVYRCRFLLRVASTRNYAITSRLLVIASYLEKTSEISAPMSQTTVFRDLWKSKSRVDSITDLLKLSDIAIKFGYPLSTESTHRGGGRAGSLPQPTRCSAND